MRNNHYHLKIYGITGDCPALKKILNFIGHNGYDCCWFCYISGQHVNGKRQYYYQTTIRLRSPSKFQKESNEAQQTQSRINGHLGRSILQGLIDIPLPNSIVIDYLHATLLGHVKAIVIDIYNQLAPRERLTLNGQLKNQTFPHFFVRKFRSFNEFANVKAVELKNLFFYGLLPNLQTMVPLEKLSHLAMYVSAIRLLHGRSPFENDTSKIARQLLTKFYEDHQLFYNQLQNFVLHLHVHYPELYLNHGALSNIGTFGQEDLIGAISSSHHGTRYFGELISHYYNIDFALQAKKATVTINDGPNDPSNDSADQYEGAIDFHSRLCDDCSELNDCLTIYRRFIIHRQTFHSLIYYKRRQSVSYFVEYMFDQNIKDRRFGVIKYFFTHKEQGYAAIEHHPTKCLYSDYFRRSKYYGLLKEPLDFLFFVLERKCDNTNLVHTSWIVKHCIVIEMDKSLIVTPISVYDEHD